MQSPELIDLVAQAAGEGHRAARMGNPSRRHMLYVVGAAAPACLMACIAQSTDKSIGGVSDPEDPDNPAGEGGTDETGGPAEDSGGTPGEDTGAATMGGEDTGTSTGSKDTGTSTGSKDTGTSTGSKDTGTPPPPDTGPTCTPTGTNVGSVSSFPVNSWKLLSSSRLIIGHDSGGIYAMTARCTHSGVTVNPPDSKGNTYCSAHGARFDANGNATAPPAYSPLRHYAVTVCSGSVYVDTSTTVSQSTRTPAS